MLKKTSYKFTTIIIVIALFQISMVKISTNKNDNFLCKKVTVSGTVKIHTPYCGGAYPPPELANGTFSPYANSSFSVVAVGDSVKRKSILNFSTDSNGEFSFKIAKGKYWIYSANKMQSYETFYKQNTSKLSKDFVLRDKNCIKKWYNTPDFELSAMRDTSIEIIFHKACFTGLNPCLQYTGPRPQ